MTDSHAQPILVGLRLWRWRLRRWLAIIGVVLITWFFICIGGVIGWQIRGSDDLLEMRSEIQTNRAAIESNRAEIMLHASPSELVAIQNACPPAARGVAK